MVTLPQLAWRESPNQSARILPKGRVPHLIVAHRPVGSYQGSISWLCNPKSQASAHVITEGEFTQADIATQLVPWDRKAWTESAFNSLSYGIEIDDNAWVPPHDHSAWLSAARIIAFICYKTGIPAVWTRDPLYSPGICRHYDLGLAGGGHSDPTLDRVVWGKFILDCRHELETGGFRKTWGRGKLLRIR